MDEKAEARPVMGTIFLVHSFTNSSLKLLAHGVGVILIADILVKLGHEKMKLPRVKMLLEHFKGKQIFS